jgi:hypothetical protein
MGSTGSSRSIHQRKVSVHALDVENTSPKRWACMRKSHAHRCLLNDTPLLPPTDVKLPWMLHTCMRSAGGSLSRVAWLSTNSCCSQALSKNHRVSERKSAQRWSIRGAPKHSQLPLVGSTNPTV